MNLQKSEMRMVMAQEMGKTFEARETALNAEVHRFEGAIGALKQCYEKMDSVKAFYQREVDDTKFDEKDLELVFRVIDRCKGVAESLADTAGAQKLMRQGEALEAKRSLDLVEKMFQDEHAKMTNVLANIEDGTLTDKDVSTNPDGSLSLRTVGGKPMSSAAADLDARRAEARAAKQQAAATVAVETPEAVSSVSPQTEPAKDVASALPVVEDVKPMVEAPTPVRKQVVARRSKR